jgi:hypothetical protein
MTSFISFARRRRDDSSVESICTRCCETVATERNEASLQEAERIHYCEPPERLDISKLCP